MIVKNERPIICRCLDSVMPFIDTWVIVDTGSNDGTQEVIRRHLKAIPGELHERPWVNFAHNRNEAMQLAWGKADYLLFIDADDKLITPEAYQLPPLSADIYFIQQREAKGTTFRDHHVFFLIRNNTDLKWEGVLHEYLACPTKKTRLLLSDIYCCYINDGNRSKDPQKCNKDIATLKEAAMKNPTDSRSVFYLARTYWSICDWASAKQWFQRRATMGGDPIEIYLSLLYVALAQKNLNEDPGLFIDSFARAHLFRPTRTEAIYEIGRYFVETDKPLLGYAVLKVASEIPPSEDNLFVESWVNDWGIPLYLFLASTKIGKNREATDLLERLLTNPDFPATLRKSFQLDRYAQHFSLFV